MEHFKAVEEFLAIAQQLGFEKYPSDNTLYTLINENVEFHIRIHEQKNDIILYDIINERVETLDFLRNNLTVEDHINKLKEFIK